MHLSVPFLLGILAVVFLIGLWLGSLITNSQWKANAKSYLRLECDGRLYKVMFVDGRAPETPDWDLCYRYATVPIKATPIKSMNGKARRQTVLVLLMLPVVIPATISGFLWQFWLVGWVFAEHHVSRLLTPPSPEAP